LKHHIHSLGAIEISTIIQWMEDLTNVPVHSIQHFQIVTRSGAPSLYVGVVLCSHHTPEDDRPRLIPALAQTGELINCISRGDV
jgi:hypothetical protein